MEEVVHVGQGEPKPIRRFPRLPRRFPRLPIETKKETYYVVRCKSSGNFWHVSLDEFMEELDHLSFEDSPLGAARVGEDPGDFEEELKVIEKYLSKGEFDATDFELVRVDVSYTLSPP